MFVNEQTSPVVGLHWSPSVSRGPEVPAACGCEGMIHQTKLRVDFGLQFNIHAKAWRCDNRAGCLVGLQPGDALSHTYLLLPGSWASPVLIIPINK